MQYTLQRYEKNKNHEGEVISIFIALSIKNGEENIIQEHWLTQEEMAAVLADQSALIPILEAQASEGHIRLEEYIATKPQPPEIATPELISTFVVSTENVSSKVETLKAERLEEVSAEEIEPEIPPLE